ncbi:MAG: hypothetical protein R2909_08690 [Gemmatimonadales bacterium]
MSVSVTPGSIGARVGVPKQFIAKVYHEDGSLASVPVFWTASGGSIGQDGVYLPDSPGDQIVIAVIGAGLVDTAEVRVSERPFLTSILLSPGEDTVDQGSSLQYVVAAEWSDGGSDLPTVDFSTTGGVIDSTGVFNALALPGDYIVVAKERGGQRTGTAKVRVQAKRVTGIDLTPATVILTPGATQRFQASGHDELGVPTQVQVNWSATGGTITNNGSYKAGLTPGTYRVIATQSGGELVDTSVVTIATPAATLTQLVLNPSAVTVAAGAVTQFSVAGSWSDGSSAAPEVTWSTTGGSISDEGDYTAPNTPGNYRVIARHTGGTKADTSTVTVVAPKLVSLSIAPGTVSIETYQTKQFNAAALWSDGGTTPPALTWTATGGTVSGTGLFTAGASPGTYRVIVRDQAATKADTAFVTISSPEPVLQDIVINPGSVSLNSGASQQFYVQGVWTNSGSAIPDVSWSATGGSVSASGRFTAGNTAGTFRVIAVATGTGIADTALVTVLPPAPVLTGIVVTPGQATVQPGNVQFFDVNGLWTNGGSGAPAVTWSATGGTINSGGAFTAGSQSGTYRVIARQVGGGFADTASVTIAAAPPALVGLVVSPDSNTVSTGASLQFGVAGVWTNGGAGTPAVTWSATGGAITSTGQYTAGSQAGTYRVIATQSGGSLADTATVFVSSSVVGLTALDINPDAITLQTGMSREFIVDAHWSNGTTTRPNLDWTANGGTVTVHGRYTAGNIGGTYKVVARHTNGTLADTSSVQILAPAVTKLTLTPGTVSMSVNGTQQFSTSANWSDGVSRPVAVTYSATGGTISVNGLYRAGNAAGAFMVIATCSCGKADTSAVTLIGASTASLVSLSITPSSATLQPGGNQQFAVIGQWSDGSSSPPQVVYSATGGSINSSGRYTAPQTTGSYLVVARHATGIRADTAVVTVQGGSGSGSGAPWFEEDFSYSSTSALLAYPNANWSGVNEDVNKNRISLDASGPPVGGKSMKYSFPDRTGDPNLCHDYTIGRNLKFPSTEREVWFEVWFKFQPGFETHVPACNGVSINAYKFVFGRVQSGRFGATVGVYPNSHSYTIEAPSGQVFQGKGPSSIDYASITDGQWHLIQWHIRTSSSNGVANGYMETRIDGVVLQAASNIVVNEPGIYGIALGRNMNQGPIQAQALWWGRARAWRSSPGWGW